MYSLKEVQAMDYLLKRMQYNGLLNEITGENSELKLVISFNNKYISGDFINFKNGRINQYEFIGSYDYENMIYNHNSIEVLKLLWESFCTIHLPDGYVNNFKKNKDLSIILEILFEQIKSIDFSNINTPLRPIMINVEYFNNESGPDFLYLGGKMLDVISIVRKEI